MQARLSRRQLSALMAVTSLLLTLPVILWCLLQSWSAHQTAVMQNMQGVSQGIRADVLQSVMTLNAQFPTPECNEALILAMRQADYQAKYLTYFSLVNKDHIVCNSFEGHLEVPVPLSKPDVEFRSGASFTINERVPLFSSVVFGRTVRVDNFLVFLDYPDTELEGSLPWLHYSSYDYGSGRQVRVYGEDETRLQRLEFDLAPRSWMEQGFWVKSLCFQQLQCIVAAVDIRGYFRGQWLATLLIIALLAGSVVLFYLLGAACHDHLYGLSRQVRKGLNPQQLSLHYQPILDTGSGLVSGCEVLCRWQRSDGQPVPPDDFIPVVEQCGLTAHLTEQVTRGCLLELEQLGLLGRMRVAINVFPQDIATGHMERLLTRLLPPHLYGWITIELTEKRIDDMDNLVEQVKRLRNLGFQVAIDDFGTGFSNLESLQNLKVDILKIDRSFVCGVEAPSLKRSLVEHICQLADTLALKVVAEGVETRHQLQYLHSVGVDYTQGYLHGRPMPAAQLRTFLQQHSLASHNVFSSAHW
ncbi:EAL domain-containing protein [Ferrimonas kyonanensis]|uniref:EAL domain-containing protein n=1 Tax=Ferrimonas kyonanensis TaxID=364763 RepID=UPI000427F214|nr:EAL domain-containing protein [Ferrimonas kyonanensis]